MRLSARSLTLAVLVSVSAAPLMAQSTGLSFGGMDAVSGLPVEVSADLLEVDNMTGETVFSGNAVLGQGDMRIAAPVIRLFYMPGGDGRIQRLEAEGGVTLVTAEEAAEAQAATYEVAQGTVVMTGSVILTQGQSVLSGDRLDVDLRTGFGRMDGNVRSIIQTAP